MAENKILKMGKIEKYQRVSSDELIGMKFSMLTIIKDLGFINGSRYVIVKCDCGKEVRAGYNLMKRQIVISCGCYKREKIITTHGLSKHPIFRIWAGIIARCYNPNVKAYKYYGGRGITVCDEWSNDFKTFYDWAIENKWDKSLQIDRENNNGNYEPSNCRVATKKTQARNTRTNVFYIIDGVKRCFAEWCEIYNLNYKLTHQRMKRDGNTLEELISKFGNNYD